MKRILLFIAFIVLMNVTACSFEQPQNEVIKNSDNTDSEITDNKPKSENNDEKNSKLDEKEKFMPEIPSEGRALESFIPPEWKVLDYIEGDLNQDKLLDVAVVIEKDNDDDSLYPRVLLILLQNKDKSYKLSVKAGKAILRANEGGIWGDPYVPLSIDKGSLLISFYGGSNWRWSNEYRFKFQEDKWLLIGAKIEMFHTGSGEGTHEDYNLLTGEMIKTETDANGNKKTEEISRGKKPLVKLTDFIANSEDIQY